MRRPGLIALVGALSCALAMASCGKSAGAGKDKAAPAAGAAVKPGGAAGNSNIGAPRLEMPDSPPVPGAKPPPAEEEAPLAEPRKEGTQARASGAKHKALVDKVVQLYSVVGGTPVNVLETTVEHGLLRVMFAERGSANRVSTVFVTLDGAVIFEGGYEIGHELETLAVDRIFADCLKEAGLKVHGHPGHGATRTQLKVIGRFAGGLLEPCKDKATCEAVTAKLGVKQLPAITVGATAHTGPLTRGWLETMTGCK